MPGTKIPTVQAWPTIAYKLEDIGPNYNIAVKLGGLRSLIDLDVESAEIARYLIEHIPNTFAFGRESNHVATHYMYYSNFKENIKTLKLKDSCNNLLL